MTFGGQRAVISRERRHAETSDPSEDPDLF
jgi:hypothetical protein